MKRTLRFLQNFLVFSFVLEKKGIRVAGLVVYSNSISYIFSEIKELAKCWSACKSGRGLEWSRFVSVLRLSTWATMYSHSLFVSDF
jgi:hypothetical protein